MIGENTGEMLACGLQLEIISQKTVKEGIAACEAAGDYVSRAVFQDILDDTEEHIDWIETQIDLIDKVGLQNYLQSQMSG
jgi:bacterioferritin